MIVVDTSVWVHMARRTGHPSVGSLKDLIRSEADLATTEGVVMELLAGAGSETAVSRIRDHLLALTLLPLEGLADFEDAALLYRTCRRAGETLRGFVDCLIAVPAIRAGAEMLHADRDFDVIARHSDLRVYAYQS